MLEMQKLGTKERVTMPQNFLTFRNGYLFVYSMMMGEWGVFSHISYFISYATPPYSFFRLCPLSPTAL
jgi:hypothetical protein